MASTDNTARPKWEWPRESVVQLRIKQLGDKDPKTRAFAARSLGWHFSEYAPRMGAPMFEEGEAVVLVGMGDPMEAPLDEARYETEAETFGQSSWEFWRALTRQTVTVGEMRRAFDAVVAALEGDENGEVRKRAAEALGRTKDFLAIEPLAGALADEDLKVAAAAVFALSRIREDRAADLVLAALRSEHAQVRAAAVWAIGVQKHLRGFDFLVAALDDADQEVRETAAEALGIMGELRAVKPLIDHLTDEAGGVRRWSAFALGELADTAAVKPLVKRLRDKEVEVREHAARALGKLGDVRTVEALIDALYDEAPAVRCAAVGGLLAIGAPEAHDALDAACGGVDIDKVATDYARYIQGGDDADGLPLVVALLTHYDQDRAIDYYWSGSETLRAAARYVLNFGDEWYEQVHPDSPERPKWGAKKNRQGDAAAGSGIER